MDASNNNIVVFIDCFDHFIQWESFERKTFMKIPSMKEIYLEPSEIVTTSSTQYHHCSTCVQSLVTVCGG